MFLDTLVILNYRSCRNLSLQFRKDEPNVFIGINDCGKTTVLKSIGLLLDEKPNYHFVRENSSKRDLSNSPLSIEDLQSIFSDLGLPFIKYSSNQTVMVGKLCLEDADIDDADVSGYTNQLLWAVETVGSELWLARVYDSEKASVQSYLLTTDCADQTQMKLWSASAADLNKKVKEYSVTD